MILVFECFKWKELIGNLEIRFCLDSINDICAYKSGISGVNDTPVSDFR